MGDRLFGTNGVRGVVNDLFTPEFALRLGQALGVTLGTPILVAWDGRRGSPMATHALLAGLTAVGCDARIVGAMPTPCLQFACKGHGLPGIIVTASHNPPEYTGFKVVEADGVEIPRAKEDAVEAAFHGAAFPRPTWRKVGKVEKGEGDLEAYIRAIGSHVDKAAIARRRLKVVVDPGHGVGTLATPRVLRELGCRVETINATLDGDFPGRPSEPTPANLRGLTESVVAQGADLGIAHDGDADRCIATDEAGRVEGGERSFALIARWFLSRHPRATVVTPVSSSQVIPLIAGHFGSRVEWTPVGSIHVSRAMVQLGAPLGGEENGGLMYGPHQPVRDGAMAAALLVQLLAEEEESASALFGSFPHFYLVKDRVPCPPKAQGAVMGGIAAGLRGVKVEVIDGLKIWETGEGWVLVRPSGTEPMLRIFAEAATEAEALGLAERYRRRVEEFVASTGAVEVVAGRD